MEFQKNMLELHRKVSSKEMIIGWYATGSQINENSSLIHEFYTKEMTHQPVHLLVDTDLTDYTLSVKAFTATVLSLSEEKAMGCIFVPLPLEIEALDAERIGVDVLLKAQTNPDSTMVSDVDSLESSVNKLQELLENVNSYVNSVLEGKVKADTSIGRFLADALSALPKIDAATLERMFSNSVQDLLLVVYLANLTRTQLVLAEKLQRVSGGVAGVATAVVGV